MDLIRERLARVISRVCQLSNEQLLHVENLLERLQNEVGHMGAREARESQSRLGCAVDSRGVPAVDPVTAVPWPHAPTHRLEGQGAYIITAGTLHKQHFFSDRRSLDRLQTELLQKAEQYQWHLEAWAVFSNHYHFVGHPLTDASSLRPFLGHLHSDTSRFANQRDGESDRQVWFNYWETKLTFLKSYHARLKYVHFNAVKHRLVSVPSEYPWCSAAWFERTATRAQVKTIYRYKIDGVRVFDDFEPIACE